MRLQVHRRYRCHILKGNESSFWNPPSSLHSPTALAIKLLPGDTSYLYIFTIPQAIKILSFSERMSGDKCLFIMLVKYSMVQKDGVRTNLPLKQTLRKLDTSSKLMKCAVELSKYDISYLPRTTVKAQALADYVSKMASPCQEESPSKEV
ncbi:UNVERIFIED_CONTAM: hypothetical protein Scaly_0582500 [Sesamum calycinum]|uniref:Uncharacterized protein n=1 Tax=Sesamum calycinum TaxID=2727403 RepID=A0AAW2RS12_9LAMI